jgi:hypothetical protein
MIDPKRVAMFIPPGLMRFKAELFDRIAAKCGHTVRYDYNAVPKLPDEIVPVVGVSPQFRDAFVNWMSRGRSFIFWDRGYLARPDHYRWTLNNFQMQEIRDVPDDRWRELMIESQVRPWNKNGKHIVVAHTGPEYWDVFADREWTFRTADYLKTITDRPIIIRDKTSMVPLYNDIKDAHCLVTHGSIAAVEAVVMGCPVFVDPHSTARLVGSTNFADIEHPVYPDRQPWLNSLAYAQYNARELTDGTMFRLIT